MAAIDPSRPATQQQFGIEIVMLAHIADVAEKARLLIEAQDYVLETMQSRNSVDMRPASVLNNAIAEAIRSLAAHVGEIRSAAQPTE